MSGGEQQMLAIGRALMTTPKLIMLDEPSLGLSPKFVTLIFEKLGEMEWEGDTLMIVEQNAARVLALADCSYVMELGRNRFEGPGASSSLTPRSNASNWADRPGAGAGDPRAARPRGARPRGGRASTSARSARAPCAAGRDRPIR
jgi:energy-coupling factor transporter ATP-binding protein EcfA2